MRCEKSVSRQGGGIIDADRKALKPHLLTPRSPSCGRCDRGCSRIGAKPQRGRTMRACNNTTATLARSSGGYTLSMSQPGANSTTTEQKASGAMAATKNLAYPYRPLLTFVQPCSNARSQRKVTRE